MIVAEVDGTRREMVVDSGAAALILFAAARPASVPHGRMLLTAEGSTPGIEGSALVAMEGDHPHRMRTMRVPGGEAAAGLLPASAFGAVFVSNRGGFVEFVR